ncbi:MAG: NADH:flavin oxidoreductase/NADH oxidase [Halodesulfurarchaeum sp.]
MAAGPFSDLQIRGVTVPNRFMVSPMCQYSVDDCDGVPTEWHHVHYGTRAVGGAGIVMTEATAVEPEGRITPYDIGLWNDEQVEALSRSTSFIEEQGSIPAVQLGHAGRKAATDRPWKGGGPLQPDEGGWEVLSPTGEPWPYEEEAPPTRKLSRSDIQSVVDAFRAAAERAIAAGFEIIEIHAAHGYLLHQFLSPVTNHRDDAYGGSFEARTRLLREVCSGVREAVGEEIPLFVRISATDWMPDRDSWTPVQSVRLADRLAEIGVDLVDVSAGGIHPDLEIPWNGPNFQVPYAERIRNETESDVLVGAVGRIETPQQAAALVRNERTDLVIMGRAFLREPYFPLHAAQELGETDALEPPVQYRRGF